MGSLEWLHDFAAPATRVAVPASYLSNLYCAQGIHPRLWTLALVDAGDSLSESSGVFEGPSSSSLGSGPAKVPQDRAPVVSASASASVLISATSG